MQRTWEDGHERTSANRRMKIETQNKERINLDTLFLFFINNYFLQTSLIASIIPSLPYS